MAVTPDKMKAKQRRDFYVAGINRSIDFIESNLTGELRLAKIASAAGFSKYHFHRLFRAMVGETLNRFIQRVRLRRLQV